MVAAIVRHPVKGLPGEVIPAAQVQPGKGLPFDRALAITNGTVSVATGWTPCQAFVRLTTHASLVRFRVALGASTAGFPEIRITGPDSREITADVDDPASLQAVGPTLTEWFGRDAATPNALVTTGHGLWDHEDATLSLLNLATVRSLALAAGVGIEPERFRANLHIEGWAAGAEHRLAGRRLIIGDVVLEVLRPIDRCRATSVATDGSSRPNLSVPGLLARRAGHVFCGLYARVIEGGELTHGARVRVDGRPRAGVLAAGASAPTAPTAALWPRAARITSRREEGRDVVSLWLEDPLAAVAPAPRPGQHLRVHFAGSEDASGPTWRAYTVSGVDGKRLRITVRRPDESAVVSRRLHALTIGDEVVISGPYGWHVIEPTDPSPLLMLTAGIGLTPAVAALHAFRAAQSRRAFRLVHIAREGHAAPLWAEVVELAETLTNATVELRQPQRDKAGAHRSLDLSEAVASLGLAELEVLACGPASFIRSAREVLQTLGVPSSRVSVEAFISPTAHAAAEHAPPSPGPHNVTFSEAGTMTQWREGDGTLLDIGHAAGLDLPAECRAGACGTCAQRVQGRLHHILDPLTDAPDNEVLLCCVVPDGEVIVAA